MSVPILGEIEKLIIEHGSALILKQRIELAREQYSALERKLAESEAMVLKLGTERQAFELETYKLKEKVRALEAELTERAGERLDPLAEKILRLLAEENDHTAESIAQIHGIATALAEFHLNELRENRMVGAEYNAIYPTTWHLAQEGRRYLVTHGFLG